MVASSSVIAAPAKANDQLVPVLSYNTNAIPVNGLERLEVLRDGAAAIYGADAVAGVVNTVLKTDYQGAELSLQYGGAEGTGLREFNANGVIGTNFAENRGNITLFGSYDHGTGLDSTEQYYTESSDRRGLFEGRRPRPRPRHPRRGVGSCDAGCVGRARQRPRRDGGRAAVALLSVCSLSGRGGGRARHGAAVVRPPSAASWP